MPPKRGRVRRKRHAQLQLWQQDQPRQQEQPRQQKQPWQQDHIQQQGKLRQQVQPQQYSKSKHLLQKTQIPLHHQDARQRVDTKHSIADMLSYFKLRRSFIGFTGQVYDQVTKSQVRLRLALWPFNSPHTEGGQQATDQHRLQLQQQGDGPPHGRRIRQGQELTRYELSDSRLSVVNLCLHQFACYCWQRLRENAQKLLQCRLQLHPSLRSPWRRIQVRPDLQGGLWSGRAGDPSTLPYHLQGCCLWRYYHLNISNIVYLNYSRETILNSKINKHRNRIWPPQFSSVVWVFQIEYVGEAVENSGTSIAIRGKDGVVFAVEKIVTSKLYEKGANRQQEDLQHKIEIAAASLVNDARQFANILMYEVRNIVDNIWATLLLFYFLSEPWSLLTSFSAVMK